MLTQTLIVSCALKVAQSAADNEPVIVRAEDADWSSYFQLAAIYIRHLFVLRWKTHSQRNTIFDSHLYTHQKYSGRDTGEFIKDNLDPTLQEASTGNMVTLIFLNV